MLVRAGGAQRGHGVAKAPLRERDHVHVALGHQRIALVAQSGAPLEQAVQLAPLAENGGLGRVEVLGLALVQHPSAEADDLALRVADREHDAVAEPVVSLAFGLRLIGLVGDHQTRFDQQRVVVAREGAGQAPPAVGGIAQAEAGGDLAGQAAALEVGHGARRFLELLLPVLAGLGEHIGEQHLLGLDLLLALAFFGPHVVVGHLHALHLREVLDRVDEAQATVLHQEAHGVAMHPAAETVVGLAGRADDERRRLLAVEGAQALEVDPGLLQRDVAAHDIGDVGAGQQVLDERRRDHGGGRRTAWSKRGSRIKQPRRWAAAGLLGGRLFVGPGPAIRPGRRRRQT